MKTKTILLLFIIIFISCKNQNNKEESKKLCNKAYEYINKEKYTTASDLLEKAIEKDSENYNAFIGKSIILTRQNNFKDALKQIEEVVKLKPEFAESWTMKGMLNDILKNKNQAIKDYEKSIKCFESRKDDKNNDINIYYSLYLINNQESKQKIKSIEAKWKSDNNITEFFKKIKEHTKDETLKKMLLDK